MSFYSWMSKWIAEKFIKLLTIFLKKSIIDLYYFERMKKMLKKYWKKIGMLILIIACVFNIMNKFVHRLSLNKEMVQSARYVFSEQLNESKEK